MSLEEYNRKRSFEKTPEPKGAPPRREQAGNRFYVQRHHATRLHYDLRLEVGGTLKSWAVPKGPTLDPSDKRLAMKVEDHPLEYGTFEGNIPAGNYGAGSVMLWDLGTFELLGDKPAEKQLESGDFKFRLKGEKLEGEFALVLMKGRGKGNEWLLLKKKDATATPGWNPEDHARSVLTDRTQEEIARDLPPKQPSVKKAAAKKGAAKKTTETNGEPAAASIAAKLPAAVRVEMPADVTPMAAFSVDAPPHGEGWIYEVKWDGIRAICFVNGHDIRLVSRNGNPCESQYPELSALSHYLSAETAILDGEIAVLDENGRPSFALIQPRISVSGAATIANLSRTQPVTYFVFDLLYLDGYDLREAPLVERKKALASILKTNPLVRYSEHVDADGAGFLEAARANQLEGIIAKRADSSYESKRSRNWLKVKIVAQQEFVICGYTKGERGGNFGALVVGIYDEGKLFYAGNVGTGFNQNSLAHVYGILQNLVTPSCPFPERPAIKDVTWVRPEIVCELKFANWTRENRLRAPVFLGLRQDADPTECVREVAEKPPEAAPPSRSNTSSKSATSTPQALLSGKTAEVSLAVDGKQLKFTNLNKVFFPKEGYNKRDLINFYDGVADLLIPHLKDRPLSLKRYPNGIESDFFFQKEAAKSFPSWLRIEPVFSNHNQAPINYVIADDRASLLYLANLGCIDQNPWMSRVGSLEHPDFILIDLDPQDCSYAKIVEAAQLVRKKLDLLNLEGYPKTTGGDGMHIYIPVEPRYTYEQTKSFAEIIARVAAAERPDLFTTPRTVSRRQKGKVYFDFLQNGEGKTIAAPYVVRAYPGAPIATPLKWAEVTPKLSPTQFNIENALDRFDRYGDLFQPVLTKPQPLEKSLEKLEALVHG